MTDAQGIPIGCSTIIAGNHHDAYKLEDNVEAMLENLQKVSIDYKGLFLNADAGFDTTSFRAYCERKEIIANIDENKRNQQKECDRDYCLDELLYEDRFVIERTNAWIDAFKTLLVRFETSDLHWRAWHIIAFSLILIRF